MRELLEKHEIRYKDVTLAYKICDNDTGNTIRKGRAEAFEIDTKDAELVRYLCQFNSGWHCQPGDDNKYWITPDVK